MLQPDLRSNIKSFVFDIQDNLILCFYNHDHRNQNFTR